MALIDKLEKFAGTTLSPGRFTIKGYPVDIQDSDGSYITMIAVDSDAATGIGRALKQAGFSVRFSGKSVTIMNSSYQNGIKKAQQEIANKYPMLVENAPGSKAYKEGFDRGMLGESRANPYEDGDSASENDWEKGYEEGRKKGQYRIH